MFCFNICYFCLYGPIKQIGLVLLNHFSIIFIKLRIHIAIHFKHQIELIQQPIKIYNKRKLNILKCILKKYIKIKQQNFILYFIQEVCFKYLFLEHQPMSLLKDTKKQRPKNSAKLPKLSIQQQIDNNEVIQRMNRKITFTKNQRHLGTTITYNQALNNTQKQFGINHNFTSNISSNNNLKFKSVPQYIVFNHFQPHRTYQSQIKLVNLSQYIQRIKITPFSKKQFNIFSINYPKQDSGDIAPGLAVTIVIRFRPLNLTDLDEELIVIFNGGTIKVPIIAKRQRPSIEWPKLIDCGHCWVGNIRQQEVTVMNNGGQAEYHLVQAQFPSQQTTLKRGYFKITPTVLRFAKQSSQRIHVLFEPQQKGNFKQIITFKSIQGQQQCIKIQIKGGAYNAQLILQKINGQQLKQQNSYQNNLYINGTEVNKYSTAEISIKNLAVVDVDYFWYFDSPLANQKNNQGQQLIQISNNKGKLIASASANFSIKYLPQNRNPYNIRAELYLFNLPQKSLVSKSIVKKINGIQAIQCLVLNIKTRPTQSSTQVFPLHKQIVQPLYRQIQRTQSFTILNNSQSKRSYKIKKISSTQYCQVQLISQSKGILEPKQEKTIYFLFQITQLTRQQQRGYFLIQFDNSPGKIFSVGGYVQYPQIKYSQTQIFYGLCRTYTKIKKQLILTNQQYNQVSFKIINPIKYYQLDFYDFYQFDEEESEQFKKKRFLIRNKDTNQVLTDGEQYSIKANSTFTLELQYFTSGPESVNDWFQIQVINGKKNRIPIIVQVQQISMQMSRTQINLRQIYKGNVYNSNKFLSKQLSIQNKSNIQTTFQFCPPNQQSCIIKIQPMIFKIGPKQKKRIDLLIQPIKTGELNQQIKWKYYDDFKVNPSSYPDLMAYQEFNKTDQSSNFVKQQSLLLKAEIKGVQIKYYIKDQSRARKVRQKMQDLPTSVKHSTMSFKSSKTGFHQQQKTVYPYLEEINFYNCEINQVKQMEIIIQNDSGLTAEFNIYADIYRTLEKVQSVKKNQKGLVGQQEQAFTSQMGKTFLQTRVLDKSQKVHLSNNKGVSIMCQPPHGILHKKQTQKVMITMFNDTSGRFRDNLVIDIKDHQQKKFPMDIHIKGTPVILSRNQLGINFNQEVPIMNLGSVLVKNGKIKKSIKVVNKGPKQVHLNWKIYPYNNIDKQKDLFKLQFSEPAPGTNDIVQVKWNAIEPELDKSSPFIIEPRQKILKGRQELSFSLIVNQLQQTRNYQNLLICEPQLRDGQRSVKMQNLAVIVQSQAIDPFLIMDTKHKNHINKLQLYATQHVLKQKQTNSNNHLRKIKLKNQLKANLQFQLMIQSKNKQFQSFKIVSINTNSPINPYDGNKTFISNKKYLLAYESFIEIIVELCANKKDNKDWPLQPKTRKDGQINIKFANGHQQKIDLVGWLYRPWVQVQMPNQLLFSVQNCIIDFGTIHVKNTKKLSIYLTNPTKSDAKFTITYIKYHQSKKINFQQSLWIAEDIEDQNITDMKQCFYLSQDQGTVLNRSIPIHYMPGTLALPSQQDEYTATHKPIKIQFLFKPKTNVLYKSKFRIAIEDSIFYDVVVRGRGSFEEELEVK